MVTLLGKSSGKITAVAKAARRSKKRFSGGIDLFDCGECEFSSSKRPGRLPVLLAINDKEAWPQLRTNLVRLSLGAFCLELTNCFVVDGDVEGSMLFNPLFLSLRSLCRSAYDNEAYAIASYFALRVLQTSGFSLLHSEFALGTFCRQWFHEMLSASAPIVPHEEQAIYEGFSRLVTYIEQTLGHPLRTHPAIPRV